MNLLVKIAVAVLCVISNYFMFITTQDESWNYDEQDDWPGQCNVGGKSQSPIDIPETVIINNDIPALVFTNWDKAVVTTVTNNGHSVLVTIPGDVKPTLSGGGLNGTYNFENLHIHWPAEHEVEGRSFDLEAHVVFYSSKFPNFSAASNDKNGVAVIGILYDTIKEDGPDIFTELACAAKNVSEEVDTETITDPIIFKHLLPSDPTRFYYYRGSLTTPNCNEVVSWFIFKNIGEINIYKYEDLTTIYDSHDNLLYFTNREIQNLNGRPVYYKLS